MSTNRECPNQTAWMRTLIWTFAGRLWQKGLFPRCSSICIAVVNGKQYRAVGCYHSPSTKVLSITVQNLRPDIDWYNLSATVNNCAALSSQYELFGIEFYGECYATTSYYDADFSRGEVAVHQCDSKCANGVGAASVMFVYQWI